MSNRETETTLAVEEAKNRLYNQVAESIGWKLLKSQHCIKKTVKDLVFQIDFYSSKWNESYKNIEVQCEFNMWCKKFDKTLTVNSYVGCYKFNSPTGEWWTITNETQLSNTIEQLCEQIRTIILPLVEEFDQDFMKATKTLLEDNNFQKFDTRLEFAAYYLGTEQIKATAKKFYDSLPDTIKQEIMDYKQGDRTKAWMINSNNLKYIIDNDILE